MTSPRPGGRRLAAGWTSATRLAARAHQHAEHVAGGDRDAQRGDRVLAHILARALDPAVLQLEPFVGLLAEALGVGARGLRRAVDGVMRGAARALESFVGAALRAAGHESLQCYVNLEKAIAIPGRAP